MTCTWAECGPILAIALIVFIPIYSAVMWGLISDNRRNNPKGNKPNGS